MNWSRLRKNRWAWWAGALLTLGAALAGCQGASTNPPAIKTVTAPVKPSTDKAISMKIFNEQCAQCHSIGAIGKKDGIPLDHEGSSRTPKWLEVQIRHPEIHNPKTLMPLFPTDRISANDMKALTRYLSSLK